MHPDNTLSLERIIGKGSMGTVYKGQCEGIIARVQLISYRGNVIAFYSKECKHLYYEFC